MISVRCCQKVPPCPMETAPASLGGRRGTGTTTEADARTDESMCMGRGAGKNKVGADRKGYKNGRSGVKGGWSLHLFG